MEACHCAHVSWKAEMLKVGELIGEHIGDSHAVFSF